MYLENPIAFTILLDRNKMELDSKFCSFGLLVEYGVTGGAPLNGQLEKLSFTSGAFAIIISMNSDNTQRRLFLWLHTSFLLT